MRIMSRLFREQAGGGRKSNAVEMPMRDLRPSKVSVARVHVPPEFLLGPSRRNESCVHVIPSARFASLRAGLRQRGRNLHLSLTRHLFLSAQARLGNVAGYYQSSLAGLVCHWFWQCRPGERVCVAAYGARHVSLNATQGLRTWARLFRASGAGV